MERYQRTSDGLWLRGRYVTALGCLEFAAARRFVRQRNQPVVSELGDDGEVIGVVHLADGLGDVWRVFGSVSVDAAPFVAYAKEAAGIGLGWQDAYDAVLRQTLDLCVAGFGDGLAEVAGWFEAPLDCHWCKIGERYVVLDAGACAGGSLFGLEGIVIEAEGCSGGAIDCAFMYDGRRVDVRVGAAEFASVTKIL